ncbi:hypothetical protein GCM10007242_34440 [Pigmentiphaga litoralis]|uniref:LVIVD repeat-containing protein n=1 Tax=Pigmentiphaga litoralis TaxID=516702 RepID=UPI001673C170|nr:RNA polymerase subunit sigma-70 [Pigmentiphaga litoralis]GGX24096.1 hypothetical protein GCM10007242_34440 [Pigmentiphaga litoralis]
MSAHPPLTQNINRLSRLELPGAGQVTVQGNHTYVGHIPNKAGLGTSILDVSDPRNPRIVSQIMLDDPESHTHKARVVGDIMIVNNERNMTLIGRKADELPGLRIKLRERFGRAATHAELADALNVREVDIPAVEAAEKQPYDRGGFKIYDVSDKTRPRLLCHQKTGGIGVHRFDMDENYAYISTEMAGYIGNILVIYDIRNPVKPQEVSRWWIPGQHLAGGETPTWNGRRTRLHHALRYGDELWAGLWHGGVGIIDIRDITRPTTLGMYNYHPPFPEPSHTFMPLEKPIGGRRIALAIDEEDHAHDAEELDRRKGRPHGCLWVMDVTDPAHIQALSSYEVSELDSPWSRATPGRFGAHQFQEQRRGTMVYCAWFAGGLRVVDVADPMSPREVGYFIPDPAEGRAAPQTNDVFVDDDNRIYMVDRYAGFDILEHAR